MREARFGEHFEIDPANRMDVLREQELPEYVAMGRELREKLKQTIETKGWPEVPHDVESVEDFFTRARDTVAERWLESAASVLQHALQKSLPKIPEDKEYNQARAVINDPEQLEEGMRLQQVGVLETLRPVAPEVWRALTMASSERQLAAVVLARRWAKEISDDQLTKMGITRDELGLFLDTAGMLGKFVDHAFVKQIELADQPGGSSPSRFAEHEGSEFRYDLYQKGSRKFDIKSYSEVFPNEWPRLVARFETLAGKTEQLLKEGKIPETYRELPNYLRHMAAAYGSSKLRPQELDALWSDMNERAVALAESGCPIMLIPQGAASVAGEAEKVDVEMRLGFRTEKTKELEKGFDAFRATAQGLNTHYQHALADTEYEVPRTVLNVQPFAFGPNLVGITRGESGAECILSHTDAVTENAVMREMPLLKKMFGIETVREGYNEAAVVATVLHELGHMVLPVEYDEAVHDRVGVGSEADMLDELKAEVVGMKIFKETTEAQHGARNIKEIFTTHFIAELGTLCDYLVENSSEKGSSGEGYFGAGVEIIDRLFQEGIIIEEQGRYRVTDPERGVAVIAEIGGELLEKFYADTTSRPKDVKARVKAYVGEIRKKKNNPEMKRFLERLKAKA